MKKLFLLILLCLAVQSCMAEVTMSTDQKEYSFPVGGDASIAFGINSSYTNSMPATLQYSLTQESSQAGMSFSQTSTQQQSLVVSPGSSRNGITLNAASPVTYLVHLDLLYQDAGKQYSATLPELTVHFVPNGSPQNNTPDPQQSTTNEVQTGQSGGQDPFDQMDQEMNQIRQQHQELLNQMMQQSAASSSSQASRSSQSQQSAQQAVQNNQMNTESSALQQQLQQETEEKKQQQQQMTNQVRQDQNLQNLNQQLKQAGYSQSSGSLEPQDEKSGSFMANYTRPDGEEASIQGSLQNGSVDQINATGDEHMPVPNELSQDSRYNKQRSALQNQSYQQKQTSIQVQKNQTTVEQQYQTPDGKNATIQAVIQNGTVQQVQTTKEEPAFPLGWAFGIILVLLLIALLIFFGYRYYQKLQPAEEEEVLIPVEQKIVDPRGDALRMLDDAERSYQGGASKEAYALAGRAARLYISGKFGFSHEGTNEEILGILQKNKIKSEVLRTALDICSLVEFAKKEDTAEEFSVILADIRSFIEENP